jgi:hypothetical protein
MDVEQRHVLRWVFVRDEQRITCELSLGGPHSLHEFSIVRGDQPASIAIDRFAEPAHAFDRQCRYEAALIDDGWTLETYRSARVAPGAG